MEIPPDMGRTMFGIADPTETLQYGQVFVRYTEKITNRSSSFNAKKCTVTGRVMITKNPCIVSGDVRVFEAVDIPSLHYLVGICENFCVLIKNSVLFKFPKFFRFFWKFLKLFKRLGF